jgi:hypothetical protein
VEQNSDKVRYAIIEHHITVIISVAKIYISGWLGGAREDCCPQKFKWVLEHRELVLPSSGC